MAEALPNNDRFGGPVLHPPSEFVHALEDQAILRGLLVAKGADEISIVYDDAQQPCGLKWSVVSPRLGRVAFALPCNTDAVFVKLTEQRIMVTSPESRRQQAIRTSWRILKDWVEAQMALLETGMVTMDEIFLPYMLSGGQTFYQALVAGEFKALNPPQD